MDVFVSADMEGVDRFTAACRPTIETGPEIEAAARRAAERAADGDLAVPDVAEPTTTTATWATTNQAARAAGAPGVQRAGARRTAVTAERYPAAFEATVGMLRAGGSGTDPHYG